MKEKRQIFFVWLIFLLLPLSLNSEELIFSKAEFAHRRQKLMARIPDGVAIILGAQPTTGYREFFQNNDFFYYSGVEIPNAILLIDGHRRESLLFSTITETAARNEGISLNLVRNPQEVTGIERIFPIEQFPSYLTRLANQGYVFYTSFKPEELPRECSQEKFNILYNNMMLNPWDGRLTRELQFIAHLKQRFPQTEVKDCSSFIWEQRQIKSPAEIDLLRQVAKIGVEAHLEMMKATRVGAYEYELAAAFEYACRKRGADLAYYVIISSGENHPYLHYYKHDRLLQDGDFLVVDAGPDFKYYDVDISASYPANGKFTPRQREIYEACLAIQRACLEVYRPGITCEQVQEEVRKILIKKGHDVEKDLFKIRTMQGGCSHYVGMAVHDVGGSPRGPLQPGMVFACDIYAVFPAEKLGVRIEDTVVITERGCENLTKDLPREIAEIEAIMAKAKH